MTNLTAANLIEMLAANANPEKAKNYMRFFKTGKGQYGEGDLFLGLTVPMTREVTNDFKSISVAELEKLAQSEYHEARVACMVLMVDQYRKAKSEELRQDLYDLYLRLLKRRRINNWDLIDISAPTVLGRHLFERDRGILYEWIKSEDLWYRRAALVACAHFIAMGQSADICKLSEMVLNDKHDLIHKASGWMLREVGKRCSVQELREFLNKNVKQMPRTMLRYSIEKLDENERQSWLKR